MADDARIGTAGPSRLTNVPIHLLVNVIKANISIYFLPPVGSLVTYSDKSHTRALSLSLLASDSPDNLHPLCVLSSGDPD